MNEVNIYQMNLNPYMINDERKKSKEINEIFKYYQKNYDKSAIKGEVHMQSFRPLDNKGYDKYVEFCLEGINKPTILVFSNLFDLDTNGDGAYSRLIYATSMKNIKAIYFTKYSLKKAFQLDEDSYGLHWKDETLGKIFRKNTGTKPKIRRSFIHPELKAAIIKLRSENPPVLLLDIADTLGLSYSLVRRYAANAMTSSSQGESINNDQKGYLLDVYEKIKREELKRIEVRVEEYKP